MNPSIFPIQSDPEIGHDIRQRSIRDLYHLAVNASLGTPLAESVEAEISIREEMLQDIETALTL